MQLYHVFDVFDFVFHKPLCLRAVLPTRDQANAELITQRSLRQKLDRVIAVQNFGDVALLKQHEQMPSDLLSAFGLDRVHVHEFAEYVDQHKDVFVMLVRVFHARVVVIDQVHLPVLQWVFGSKGFGHGLARDRLQHPKRLSVWMRVQVMLNTSPRDTKVQVAKDEIKDRVGVQLSGKQLGFEGAKHSIHIGFGDHSKYVFGLSCVDDASVGFLIEQPWWDPLIFQDDGFVLRIQGVSDIRSVFDVFVHPSCPFWVSCSVFEVIHHLFVFFVGPCVSKNPFPFLIHF